MSTRAIYTFIDEDGSYNVYKHSDSYPSGAADTLRASLAFAWQLPRFEADEFAAAFVVAGKAYWYHKEMALRRTNGAPEDLERAVKYGHYDGGGIRLLASGKPMELPPGDIEYRYEIRCKAGHLHITAFQTNYWHDPRREKKIFAGTLDKFEAFAKKQDTAV